MAIGDTLRPELIRSDTSGILQGGLAAGRSAERGLSQFGAVVGAAWKDLNEKKQKRRDEAEAAQAIQRLDPSLSSADALAMARNKNVMDFQSRMKADEQAQQLMEHRDLQINALKDAARRLEEQEAAQKAASAWLLQPQGGEVTEVRVPGRTLGEVAEGFLGGLPEALETVAQRKVALSPSDKQDVRNILKSGSYTGYADVDDALEEWKHLHGYEEFAPLQEPLIQEYIEDQLNVAPVYRAAVPFTGPPGGRPWLSEAFAKAGEAIGDVRLPDRIRREVAPSFVPAEAESPAQFLRMLGESDLDPQAKQNLYGEYVRRGAAELEARKAGISAQSSRLSALKTGIDIDQALNKPTGELRKEFLAQPSVKDFNKVNAAYNKIVTSFEAIKKLPEEKKAAADMAVIFSYMKILDPGSTVRESEYATAQNTTGAAGKVMNWWNNVKAGQILNDEQRQAFQKVARDIAQAQFDDLATYLDFYKGIAEQKGINTSRVIPQEFLEIREKGLSGISGSTGGGDSSTTTPGGFDVKVR